MIFFGGWAIIGLIIDKRRILFKIETVNKIRIIISVSSVGEVIHVHGIVFEFVVIYLELLDLIDLVDGFKWTKILKLPLSKIDISIQVF